MYYQSTNPFVDLMENTILLPKATKTLPRVPFLEEATPSVIVIIGCWNIVPQTQYTLDASNVGNDRGDGGTQKKDLGLDVTVIGYTWWLEYGSMSRLMWKGEKEDEEMRKRRMGKLRDFEIYKNMVATVSH